MRQCPKGPYEEGIMRLSDEVAVVTGAGRGIGRAIAVELAREGAHVALLARTESELEETAALIAGEEGEAKAYAVNVLDEPALRRRFREVEDELGPLSLLVNNAGRFNAIGPVWEVDPEDWWLDVTVNVRGVFLCCQAALPGMLQRRRGRVINLIGGGTAGPFAYGSGYGASKAAVMRFTECLAAEAEEYGVKVFAMGPGLVKTAMTLWQVQSGEGRTWLPQIQEAFDKSADVPPERAGRLACELASGRFDALHGRALDVADDLEALERDMDAIVSEDRKTLRMR
jgi:NAD(P)-dependent dehydrogenase (short-subunit alcohol dehydrogenase family)